MTRRRPDPHDPTTQALRFLDYGLYVVTGRHGDAVAAGSCTWVTQASFEPPLVVVALKADSRLHGLVDASDAFCVNALSSSQVDLAQDFFKPTQQEDHSVNGHPFLDGHTGAPVLRECPAFFECRVVGKLHKGDHTIFIGEVVHAEVREPEAKPLHLRETGWQYGG
ncbi:flavin reductase family protein [Myxococcota bacterium]|nr:flavin reductase family protein [Myxococcota bacterium]